MEARAPADGANLDSKLWETLPTELLERVLSKLPFPSLVKFRAVSKKWNAMIISPNLAPRTPEPKSVLLHLRDYYEGNFSGTLDCGTSCLSILNSRTNRWEDRALPWSWCSYRLVASDGGLFCFSGNENSEDFVVCNVLTKQQKFLSLPAPLLPPLPQGASFSRPHEYMLTGMVVNSGHYKLVVAGMHVAGSRTTLLYDSATCTWKASAPVPRLRSQIEGGDWVGDERSVVCNGKLYWYVAEVNGGYTIVKAVLQFDLQNETWSKAQESREAYCMWHFQIALYKHNVMLVHLNHDDDWPLQCEEWPGKAELLGLGPEMRSMPPEMFRAIKEKQKANGRAYCGEYYGIGHGDFFYHVMRGVRPGLRIAVEDLRTNTYSLLPFWEDGSSSLSRSEREIWAFSPSLHAFV
ncbi:hypothetical protein MPTK1_6g17030 [Marchantia polymorpha subsp. ruderalis]|uniref:F-box domain-containing protein n=2 Tax=Marchantia polymorpha TaxID=3197 RepID=A0AAF6BSW6_MARPO|nr:hypothetical protein MARPO_0144s0012 [Marchantia polymorpha]BBN15100.1 hypothetical protein Mp_6g17030 [Marchantia polymorpha subsp. ruderalis]|eukprot:PTQ29293.1 hypothetical protein MARPO_0144s0012 [Marchantia polymorpha]